MCRDHGVYTPHWGSPPLRGTLAVEPRTHTAGSVPGVCAHGSQQLQKTVRHLLYRGLSEPGVGRRHPSTRQGAVGKRLLLLAIV